MTPTLFFHDIAPDIKAILPPIRTRELLSEADFYGISNIIAGQLGLKQVPTSYSMWRHGWMFKQLKFIEQIIWKKAYTQYYLVGRQLEKQFLESHGVKNVKAIGLPFTYVPEQRIERKKNSLLIMPAHSLPYVKVDGDEDKLIDFALSLSKDFDTICFCIHQDCANNGRFVDKLTKYNIPWFIGASANDVNSLIRLRRIFEYFEFVGSNVIGSHLVYSQLCGAKFFLCDPYFDYKPDFYRDDPLLSKNLQLCEHLCEQSSYQVIRDKLPQYFVDPIDAICNSEFARNECGSPNKINLKELKYLLGWSLSGQTKGFTKIRIKQISAKIRSVVNRSRNK